MHERIGDRPGPWICCYRGDSSRRYLGGLPVSVTVVGRGAIRFRPAAGVIAPCDSMDNRMLFDGWLRPEDTRWAPARASFAISTLRRVAGGELVGVARGVDADAPTKTGGDRGANGLSQTHFGDGSYEPESFGRPKFTVSWQRVRFRLDAE